MILGVGALVANTICPWLFQEVFTKDGVTDFRGLFLVPCFAPPWRRLALALFFHPPKRSAEDAAISAPSH